MKLETRGRITVFLLSFAIWLALTAGAGLQEIIAGVVIAVIVTLIAGRFVFAQTPSSKKSFVRRAVYGLLYFFRFLWEMIKANLHVAYIVLHPMRPVKPGIVKIKTNLTRDIALTILGNSITLTPGTFTVDVDPDNRILYIHCITVLSSDIEENTKRIGQRFEPLLTEVFE